MARQRISQFILLAASGLGLTACVFGTSNTATQLDANGQPIVNATVGAPIQTTLVARDIEAPDIFHAEGPALWDGRPSLGGVWVASPDAKDPQRVIMRNPANGKFVIGALFHREADNPGPKLQISSDAADALGILAGDPVKISVTALKREQGPVTQPKPNAPLLASAETLPGEGTGGPTSSAAQKTPPSRPGTAPTAATATATATNPAQPLSASAVTASAAKAIDTAVATETAAAQTTAPTAPTPPAKPASTTSTTGSVFSLPAAAAPAAKPAATSGPLIQIGLFSMKANAERAVAMLAKGGVTGQISAEKSHGKTYWRVTATPGDKATLAKARAAGFPDAYFL